MPLGTYTVLATSCSNSNFNLGTFTNWIGCYGVFISNSGGQCTCPSPPCLCPCNTAGFAQTYPNPGRRHIIIPAPGTLDPYTCDSLLNVFPGESYCARLGDTSRGGRAEQLKYDVNVTSNSYLFIYRYAVVLESPNHTILQQPGFSVAIQDTLGNIIDSTCGYYQIYAPTIPNAPPPGWHFCNKPGTMGLYWRDWTTVGMDLTPYLGQSLRIVFTTHGCCFSAHRGYAYISTYCSALQIQTALCEGDTSATLTAPPGFKHYMWNTGDTTESITVPNPTTGATYSCTLTAYNNCTVTISEMLTYTVVHANFTYSAGCPGLTSQFSDSTWLNQNQVVNWEWDWGDASPVTNTTNPNPTHIFMNPGIYNVTMIAFSTEGCTDTITKQVTITPKPKLTNNPLYKSLCSGDHVNLILTSDVPGTLFTWTASAKYGTTTGYHNNTTWKIFLDDTINNLGTLIDTVKYIIRPHQAFCDGNDTVYLVIVNPKPSLTNTPLSKSICTGTSTNLTLTSNVAGTLFTWTCTASSPNLSGYSNSIVPGTVINQVIVNSGFNYDTVTYHITPHANGCDGDVTDYKIIIRPVPSIPGSISGPTPVCQASRNVIYSVPLIPNATSYIWSVQPASAGILTGNTQNVSMNWDAAFTGVGSLYVKGQNSCGMGPVSTNYDVTVRPNPVVSYTMCTDSITTTDALSFRLRGGIPLGGTYSGSGVTAGIFNPAMAGPGSKNIMYSYTNVYGCPATANKTISVISAMAFACGNNFTDPRNNKSYQTVEIGTQCWMAENLNYGTNILSASHQWDNCVIEKYCYNDNPANCNTFGGLYQWDELMTYNAAEGTQGLCPPGWHVPSETEWTALFNQYINSGFAGSALKYTGYSDFNALLAGADFHNRSWNFFNFAGFYWSSTMDGPYKAWAHAMNTPDPSVSYYPNSRTNAYYVRCVHN